MLKRFLVVGAVLGTGLVAIGAGTVLGVALGARALVVSAAAVKPGAAIGIAHADQVGGARTRLATRHVAPAN